MSKQAYIKEINADISYPDNMDEKTAVALALAQHSEHSKKTDELLQKLGFQSEEGKGNSVSPKETPKSTIGERALELIKSLNPDMSGVQALAHGISQNPPVPGLKFIQDLMVGPVQDLAKKINPDFVPASEQMAQSAKQHPILAGLGEAVPSIARGVATAPAALSALGATGPLAEGAGFLPKLLKLLEIGGKGAATGVMSGQMAQPSIEPSRIALDAALGGGAELGTSGITKLLSSLKGPATSLWDQVLSRAPKAILKEIKSGSPSLEEQLVERGITASGPRSLEMQAEKQISPIEEKVQEIISGIKGKVAPKDVYEELSSLRSEHLGPNGKVVPGQEGVVNKLDNLMSSFKDQMKEGWPTAMQANELKRKFWRIAGGVFEKEESPIVKEAQAAMGSGLRSGIEDLASKSSPGLGQDLANLNKEQGFWLKLRNAAQGAQSKGTEPDSVLKMILDKYMSKSARASAYTKGFQGSKQGSTLQQLFDAFPGLLTSVGRGE